MEDLWEDNRLKALTTPLTTRSVEVGVLPLDCITSGTEPSFQATFENRSNELARAAKVTMAQFERNAKTGGPLPVRSPPRDGAAQSGRVDRSQYPTLPAPPAPAPAEPRTSGTQLRGRRRVSPTEELERSRIELAEKYAAGDYPAALALAEAIQAKGPHELAAAAFARDCRRMIEAECEQRIGSFSRVPVLAISLSELRRRDLDHRAGFLLSLVDGVSSVEALLDVSAMPRVDALRMLARLVEDGILRVDQKV